MLRYLLVAFVLWMSGVEAVPTLKCHVHIVDQLYNSNSASLGQLYTGYNYKMSFGLPVAQDRANTPLAYFIELKCKSDGNGIVTDTMHRFGIPVQVSLLNCTRDLRIRVGEIANNSYDYLNFIAEMRPLRNRTFKVEMNLSMNRRKGEGCVERLTFHTKTFAADDTTVDFDDFAASERTLSARIQRFWRSTAAIPLQLILSAMLIMVLILLTATCIRLLCHSRRRCCERRNKHGIPANDVQLNYIKKRTAAAMRPPPARLNIRRDSLIRSRTASPNLGTNPKVTLDDSVMPSLPLNVSDAQQINALQEFQIVRQKIMNQIATADDYERIYGIKPKSNNLVFSRTTSK